MSELSSRIYGCIPTRSTDFIAKSITSCKADLPPLKEAIKMARASVDSSFLADPSMTLTVTSASPLVHPGKSCPFIADSLDFLQRFTADCNPSSIEEKVSVRDDVIKHLARTKLWTEAHIHNAREFRNRLHDTHNNLTRDMRDAAWYFTESMNSGIPDSAQNGQMRTVMVYSPHEQWSELKRYEADEQDAVHFNMTLPKDYRKALISLCTSFDPSTRLQELLDALEDYDTAVEEYFQLLDEVWTTYDAARKMQAELDEQPGQIFLRGQRDIETNLKADPTQQYRLYSPAPTAQPGY